MTDARTLLEQAREALKAAAKHHHTTSLPLAVRNFGSREAAGRAGRTVWFEQVPQSIAALDAYLSTPAPAGGLLAALVKLSRALGHPATVDAAEGQSVEARLIELAAERIAASTPASAAPAAPTDAQIQALWDEACVCTPSKPGWNRHLRYARSVLSVYGGCAAPAAPKPLTEDGQ